MMHWRTLALTTLLAAPLRAQDPAHVVSGVVFDSIAHAPLAGAVVQIALADERARIFTTTADAAGRYRVAGLPTGRFGIVFQHDALNAFGIEAPLRAFELGTDSSVIMDLAIESGPVTRLRSCGKDAGGDSEGMLAGYVVDAQRATPIPRATVLIRWFETGLRRNGLRTVPREKTVAADDDGRYLACGVPSDVGIDVDASAQPFLHVTGRVTIPAGGAARQDFHLPIKGAPSTASLSARVVGTDSQPVATGVASVDALAIDTPVRNGAFTLGGIPAGTWFVEIKSLGHEPSSALLLAGDASGAPVTVVLESTPVLLEAVTVIGKANRETRILSEIVSRNATSAGTTFLPGNSWLKAAETPTDVLRAARGFTQKGFDRVEGRPYVTKGGALLSCSSLPADSINLSGKVVVIYLDGLRYPGGFEVLNRDVLPRQILAIEAYPDVISAPAQWRTNDACAVVAVWTHR
jgi:hypothetical protein